MVSPELNNCDKTELNTNYSSTMASATPQTNQPGSMGSTVPVNGSNTATSGECTSAQHRKGHRRQESVYAMTGLYAEVPREDTEEEDQTTNCCHDSVVIKCHSRNPSSSIIDRERERTLNNPPVPYQADNIVLENLKECGILNCRPRFLQKYASIKVFVFLLSFLVTLQQALSSGYINSVITTIEKRFEIPSSLSGLIASSYEIGNVITVIFVSYLGSRRHIPVWIAIGAVIMGIGSLIFMLPHFIGESNSTTLFHNTTNDNICRGVSLREEMVGLGRLSSAGLQAPPFQAPHNNLRGDNCIQGTPSTATPVLLFLLAQLLLGCGGSPLFTLGTTYIDDHVRSDSASLYIGCMYSMAAFGPVLGFLLGAYLLSFHMDSLGSDTILIDPGDHRWIGMWWGGFLICGLLLIIVAIPFYSFPKTLTREKEKIRLMEKSRLTTPHPAIAPQPPATTASSIITTTASTQTTVTLTSNATLSATATATATTATQCTNNDSGYGKDIKDIPRSMWRLVCNPVYVVTCLGACMELIIVSGFVVFLPKYLETQFSLGKSQASIFTGSIAIPGACIGIFMGGCLLKRLELRPKGAVQFVLGSNVICLSCYGLLFFLGCDNVKMAGTTIPYYNSSISEPFQVNLTAACNFGCECRMNDVEPVCGNNGLTYFSPCHAGCTAFSSRSNYTNCACIHANLSIWPGVASPTSIQAQQQNDYAEVTVVPVATAGPCNSACRTIYPFLILLFFMTFIVAITQMPLLMIVLRSVSEEERSFALGMQFVIFRLFGYIPAPILFGNLIDSTCILWKSTCGERGGRCLLYDIEQFRFRYVGLCAGIKILALAIFVVDWWLVRRRTTLEDGGAMTANEIVGSIISLDKLFEERTLTIVDNKVAHERDLREEPLLNNSETPTSEETSVARTSDATVPETTPVSTDAVNC